MISPNTSAVTNTHQVNTVNKAHQHAPPITTNSHSTNQYLITSNRLHITSGLQHLRTQHYVASIGTCFILRRTTLNRSQNTTYGHGYCLIISRRRTTRLMVTAERTGHNATTLTDRSGISPKSNRFQKLSSQIGPSTNPITQYQHHKHRAKLPNNHVIAR